MTNKSKPVEVALKGQSRANPDKPMVKLADELDDSDLDNVAGGVAIAQPWVTVVEKVRMPMGPGAFHLGAWSS